MAMNIDKDKLVEAIKTYETDVLHRTFEKQLCDNPLMLLFKSKRAKRICVLSLHQCPKNVIESILEQVAQQMELVQGISDAVTFYTTAHIDHSTEDELKTTAASMYELTLEVMGWGRLEAIETFKAALNIGSAQDEDELSLVEKALYDYLASSEESSYIKNSLIYSLVLLCLYHNANGLLDTQLKRILESKFGKRVDQLDSIVNRLRQDGRIAMPKKGDRLLYLTREERDRIKDSLQRSKAEESQFDERFVGIVKKYGVADPMGLKCQLRKMVTANGKEAIEDEEKKPNPSQELTACALKHFVAEDLQEAFIEDLRVLLNENTHLTTTSFGEQFLELYRSDRYEQYVNGKKNIVVLDTKVLAYLNCAKSSYNEQLASDWGDPEYQRVAELYGYSQENKQRVTLMTTFDYLGETLGEIRKAFQMSCFLNIPLPLPLRTENIFINHYLYVREEMKALGENSPTFEQYMKVNGFTESDPEAFSFKRSIMRTLELMANAYCIDLYRNHPPYDGFEKVRNDYQMDLYKEGKEKTEVALNSDVRTSFFLSKKYANGQQKDVEYYIASWDNTLKCLRKITNDKLGVSRSYEVKKPGDLLQTLAFKTFHLNEANIGNEVFAYANETYDFSARVASLYDNVLNPYFTMKDNRNSALVVLLQKLIKEQDSSLSTDDITAKGDKSKTEEFFMTIVNTLKKNSCGADDLRSFLADADNNEFVVKIVSEALKASFKEQLTKLAYEFVDKLKAFIRVREEKEME